MKPIKNFCRQSEGTTAIFMGLALVMIVSVLSLAVDVGHLYTARNELQNVADAAALAGATVLIKDVGGVATRDCAAAKAAALAVAQKQANLQGQEAMADESRSDITITFGEWNIYAGNREAAWTALGDSCTGTSSANGVKVEIQRAQGTAYGPVMNFFTFFFGSPSSKVKTHAIAYLGYTLTAGTGTVEVPLAIPSSLLAEAAGARSNWLAWLLGPKPAQARTTNTTFKDLGSGSWYASNYYKPLFDTTKAYMFVVDSSDPNPTTVINNLKKVYTTGTPVRSMSKGTRLYPISEYQWASNNKTIFSAFKNAYNAKKDANNKWRVTVPVYSTTAPTAKLHHLHPWHLAGWLFGVGEAHACFNFWTQTYPGGNVPIYVSGFANVDITGVTYNSACSTEGMPGQVTNPLSCRNQNSVSVEVPVDVSTVTNPGSFTGGPDNQHINPSGTPGVGAFATQPRLVK